MLASFDGFERDVRVPRSMTLNVAMEHCKRKRTHLLLICDDAEVGKSADGTLVPTEAAAGAPAPAPYIRNDAPVVGLATMEDFLEELIQDEIVDETDAWHYDRQESRSDKKNAAAPVKKVVVQSKHVDLTAHLRTLVPASSVAPASDNPMAA